MTRTNPLTLISNGLLWLLPMSLLIRFVYHICVHDLYMEKSVIFSEIICSTFLPLVLAFSIFCVFNVMGQTCFNLFWISTFINPFYSQNFFGIYFNNASRFFCIYMYIVPWELFWPSCHICSNSRPIT